MTSGVEEKHEVAGGRSFSFFVDGTEYHVGEPTIKGAQIKAMAGILPEIDLLLIEEDGTQRQVSPDEEFELKPGRRFKKAPRFKRGSR